MTKPSISDLSSLLRGSLALLFAAAAVEAAGFLLTGAPFTSGDFRRNLLVSALLAFALSMPLSLIFASLRLGRRNLQLLIALISGMVFISIVFLLRLKTGVFTEKRAAFILSGGGVILFALAAGWGLWRLWGRGKNSGAAGPVILAVTAGLSSVLEREFVDNRTWLAAEAVLAGAAAAVTFLAARLIKGSSAPAREGRVRAAQLAVVLAVSLASLAPLAARRPRTENLEPAIPPNVILVTIDTLRADHLSCYRPGAAATPAMDALAGKGIVFENAVTPSSWTKPSVASLLTGLSPSAAGAGQADPGDPLAFNGVLPEARTLAEVFEDRGYFTMAEVDNILLSTANGYDQGFADYRVTHKTPFAVGGTASFLLNKFNFLTRTSPSVSREAIEMLERRPDGPFFLWVHYFDPHLPYYFHPEFPPDIRPSRQAWRLSLQKNAYRVRKAIPNLTAEDKSYIGERYGGEVLFNDKNLAELFDWLRDHGLFDPSLIVLTSDHGEELWDHGWFEHGHAFHREIIQVPLIVKLPGNLHAGARVPQWVSLTRLGATMLDAAGLEADFQGGSLLSCLDDPICGAQTPLGRFWFSEGVLYGRQRGAVGDLDGHKARIHGNGAITCYDLTTDPGERSPIPEAQCPWDTDVPSPRDMWRAHEEDNARLFKFLGGDAYKPGDGGQGLRALRDLGYIK